MWVYWIAVVALQYVALLGFGITRMSWRYLNMRDAVHAFAALAVPTVVLVGLRVARVFPVPSGGVIPLGVLAMDFVLTFLGIVGIRASRRMWGEVHDRKKRMVGGQRHRVLLIGAGEAGVIVARELSHRPDLGLQPVGFLDDDPLKRGTMIGGVSVLGGTGEVARIAQLKRVKRALITIANASGQQIRRITELCRDAGLETTIIPGIYEIVGGKVNLSRLRAVAIEDLLRRDPVSLDDVVVSASIHSRVVLVTGAGGSIGSELCRQICRFGPERLILVERYENALFEIHRELSAAFPHVPIDPRICDICDEERVRAILSTTRPQLVVHAAAHKHVPMMEWNPGEAVKNNVGGTRTVARLAHELGVERFFRTIPEAVQLVIRAGSMAANGEVFVLDMGKPVKIVDLALNLIRLSGFTPERDIRIEVTGMRPGEKLFEEVLTAEEGTTATAHDKIFMARSTRVDHEALLDGLRLLERKARAGEVNHLRRLLAQLVPTYHPNGGPVQAPPEAETVPERTPIPPPKRRPDSGATFTDPLAAGLDVGGVEP
jgi:FlaA1/EpsC-like NDP-sugar epimerase